MPYLPLNDKVIIREIKKKRSKGGIHIPDAQHSGRTAPAEICTGEVVYLPVTGTNQELWGKIKVGDQVLYSPKMSIEWEIDDETLESIEIFYILVIVS